MLTREAIQQAQDFDQEIVDVPEWGGQVLLRSMSSKALDDIQILFLRLTGTEQSSSPGGWARNPELLRSMKARVLSYCLCDAQGQLLFDDDEGREILAQRSGVVVDRLYDVAMRLNKLTEEAVAEEKKDWSTMPSTASALSSVASSGAPSENSIGG